MLGMAIGEDDVIIPKGTRLAAVIEDAVGRASFLRSWVPGG